MYGPGCSGPTDCAADQTCLHGSCVQTPTSGATLPEAHLFATPSQLRFGTMAAGESRSLSLVLENDGEAMVTIERTRIEPATAPFRIEPLGSGPFWIRPGRSRAIFVTFAPLAIGNYDAELAIESRAPTVRVTLSAP